MLKRLFELVLCLFSVPILFLLFLLISILIKRDSSGPVFYRGIRAGMHGKPFRIYKFRTMVRDADIIGSGTTALNDFRVTGVGKFLRKYKIDELPQVINIINGDMSLVGPRPELLEYAVLYEGEEKLILSVRPGLTDYSSIKYSSLDELVGEIEANKVFNETILPERTRLRLRYVKERTFLGDIGLLFLTLKVIVMKVFKRAPVIPF